MPVPVFILCSEAGSVDRQRNLVSLFNIIEKVTVTPLPESEAKRLRPSNIRVTAAWLGEAGDSEAEFEAQLAVVTADGSEALRGEALPFRVPPNKLHRFLYDVNGNGFFGASAGVAWVESRVRRKGDKGEWFVQRTPVIVAVERRLDDEESARD